jgi:hypothetical protein
MPSPPVLFSTPAGRSTSCAGYALVPDCTALTESYRIGILQPD